MLRRLYVENFLLIKDIEVEFEEGLNVISGETGTGKSMTISAVGFVIGRPGDFPDGTAVELELEAEGETYLLRRETRNGRSRYYLNGRGTTAKVVREIAEGRISIQGQNEFIKLLRSEFQRDLLDRFGGLLKLRECVEEAYERYSELRRRYGELLSKREELIQKRDFLEFRLREIEEVSLSPEEVEDLKIKAERLRNMEKIKRLIHASLQELYDAEDSAYSKLSEALKSLWRARELGTPVDALLEELAQIKDKLFDLAEELREKDLDLSQEEIDRINETLFKVQRLEKKYKKPYAEIIEEAQKIKEELAVSYNYEELIEDTKEDLERAEEELLKISEELSSKRKKSASRLEREIEEVLRGLNLEKAKLKVEVNRGDLTRFGADRIRFLFSSYGSELRPLEESASGGELTRLFLALSLVLPPADTYVFDEVDVGVSGESSIKLAKLLKKISKGMQLIVITHSAPVCAAGDVNFVTEKEFIGEIPYIRVRKLSEGEKLLEVARLMGKATENTIRGAKDLVDIVNSP